MYAQLQMLLKGLTQNKIKVCLVILPKLHTKDACCRLVYDNG